MQPNGNMPGAAQPASPVRPVAPVGPTKPVNPAAPVKPAAPAGGPTFDNGPSVVEGKGGKKTGWILGIVLCLILAAGGIGFGVWAWMDGNIQKDQLNSQISTLKAQIVEKLDEGSSNTIEKIDIDGSTNTDTDASEVADTYVSEDKGNYIYVGEWGLKIKMPAELRKVNYSFSNNAVCVSGIVAGRAVLSDKFANLYENFPGLGCVHKTTDDNTGKDCEKVFSKNGYSYCVTSSDYLFSQDEDDKDLEKDSIKLVHDILTNVDNYSEF